MITTESLLTSKGLALGILSGLSELPSLLLSFYGVINPIILRFYPFPLNSSNLTVNHSLNYSMLYLLIQYLCVCAQLLGHVQLFVTS